MIQFPERAKDLFLLQNCQDWLWAVNLITHPMCLHWVNRANFALILRCKRIKASNQSNKDGYKYSSTRFYIHILYTHTSMINGNITWNKSRMKHQNLTITKNINSVTYNRWKVKLSLYVAGKGCVGTAPLILNLGCSWKWVVSLTSWSLYPYIKSSWYTLHRQICQLSIIGRFPLNVMPSDSLSCVNINWSTNYVTK